MIDSGFCYSCGNDFAGEKNYKIQSEVDTYTICGNCLALAIENLKTIKKRTLEQQALLVQLQKAGGREIITS